ncbi:MAG: hypothetical protein IKV61_02440, partial [Clostridia bacterium]|nr:hypothetical protein [Clostridia bacterium]
MILSKFKYVKKQAEISTCFFWRLLRDAYGAHNKKNEAFTSFFFGACCEMLTVRIIKRTKLSLRSSLALVARCL